jgi:hypothetical protein
MQAGPLERPTNLVQDYFCALYLTTRDRAGVGDFAYCAYHLATDRTLLMASVAARVSPDAYNLINCEDILTPRGVRRIYPSQ